MSAVFIRWIWRVCGVLVTTVAGTVSAGVVTDGTVGPRVRLDGDFEIGADLGRQAGHNLFHSFERFSLATGERATFSGPADIRNLISRVTGGARSDIDGTIASTIPGADFYFLNPAGVMFGPNASLDLQGSFHVSTADELRFADGAKFSAETPAASSLTVAAPEAFGFLSPAPGPIIVDRSTLAVRAGEALSVIGGDITVDGGNDGFVSGGQAGSVLAEGGVITLAGVAGPGLLGISGGDFAGGSARANVVLANQAFVNATGDGGGTVRIQGGRVIVADQSLVVASNSGSADSDAGIAVSAERVVLANGAILAAQANGSGRGGAVLVQADDIEIVVGSAIAADANASGSGGAVLIDAGDLTIDGAGAGIFTGIASRSLSGGHAGRVEVSAERVELRNIAEITSGTFAAGNAGTVVVTTGELVLDGASAPFFTGIASNANRGSTGQAGSVTIVANDARILNGSQVNTTGDGGGSISVHAGSLVVQQQSVVAADNVGAADATGGVVVNAENVTIGSGSRVSTRVSSSGDGGRLTLEAGSLSIADGSLVHSFTIGDGDAAPVTVAAGQLQIRNGSELSSGTRGGGKAGEVIVEARDILLSGDGAAGVTGIFSQANRGSTGAAGALSVRAVDLEIRDGAEISAGTFGSARGGNVTVAISRMRISDEGSENFTGIRSQTETLVPSAAGGSVNVVGGDVEIRNGGQISGGTFGAGRGGDVDLAVEQLRIISDGTSRFATGVLSRADLNSTGDAGSVRVRADDLELRGFGASISTDTFGEGDAGKISVEADDLKIAGPGAMIASNAFGFGRGNAGAIAVRADRLRIVGDGSRPITTGISSSAAGFGAAGSVTVDGDELILTDDVVIGTLSTGIGEGGSITVRVADSIRGQRAFVTAQTVEADAGDIVITAGRLIDLQDSEITTSAAGGQGGGGSISIDPEFLILDASRIVANARQGAGGNIRIVADNFIMTPDSLVDASSDLGIDGVVEIVAPEVDLSGGLVVLEGALLDAASQLRERCGARRDIGASSFTGVGRGGLPPSPDGPLAGAYVGRPAVGGATPDQAAVVPPAPAGSSTETWAVAAVAPCVAWPETAKGSP